MQYGGKSLKLLLSLVYRLYNSLLGYVLGKFHIKSNADKLMSIRCLTSY
uniref:Uncharacterized protein n=1 Tax=Anguilla anguilla TaxID=7936 RepID=A0A0E9T196_ANGAN